ncbi:MAG: hypothetical protein ABI175_30875 [Polyangiales bacterium]
MAFALPTRAQQPGTSPKTGETVWLPVPSASAATANATASATASAIVAPTPPPASAHAAIHHAPVATAKPHEVLTIAATIDYPNLVKKAVVRYRLAGGQPLEVPFLRGNGEEYVASIPAEDVRPPGLAYAIEIEETAGGKLDAFASTAQMHDVRVEEDIDDLRERALLAQLGGRRSVVSTSFDYVMFGSVQPTGTSSTAVEPVSDRYYRAEAIYTYRPLRFIVEFSIRIGMVRGSSPIPNYNPTKPDDVKVGLNYGAPTVIMRLDDAFHLEASALTSVTEQGFSSGVGGALHIGQIYGSKLVVGFETVKTFGSRGYARLDLVRQRFRVSPIVEVTDMPHADRAGIRLLAEVAFAFGDGWGVVARGGYQARDFKTGGPGLGLAMSYAF